VSAAGPVLLVGLLAGLYLAGLRALRRRGRPWDRRRTAAFVASCAALLVALASPLAARDDELPVHMAQHLLSGMLAPALLALSAPVSLALRTAPRPVRQRLLVLLRSRVVGVLTRPVVAGTVNVAGLWVLYLTPLYAATLEHPLLHEAVHVHVVLAGCLLAWPLVSPDPVAERGAFGTRLTVLVVTAGLHAALAKLLYAGHLGGGLGDTMAADELHAGALVMSYGGDLVDVLLLIALFSRWHADRGRAWAREQRRAGTSVSVPSWNVRRIRSTRPATAIDHPYTLATTAGDASTTLDHGEPPRLGAS
jgi:putative membrane protein